MTESDDLGHNRQGHFFRGFRPDVEADGAMNAAQLLVGETLLFQALGAFRAGFAAANGADIANIV